MAAPDYFSTEAVRKDLKRKTVRGGVWTGAAQAIGVAVRLISIPILARLLDAEDYGIMQMAVVFTGVGQLLIDAGISSATVQRETLTRQQSTNMFWVATALGALLATATVTAAYPIGWWYQREEVVAVVAALSLPFALSGMASQHQALMRRAMRFSTLSTIYVASVVAAQSVAIGVAYATGSYWALVAGQLTQPAVTLVASWIASGWRPGWFQRGAGTRSMVEFGANLSLARFVNYVSWMADRAVVGTFLGADALGYYQMAHKSLSEPVQSINGPMNAVMNPALSRLVGEPERYRKAYFAALQTMAAVGLSMVMIAALDAQRLVPLVLGDKWAPSIPIFIALIPAAAFSTMKPMFSWSFVSRGRGKGFVAWHLVAGSLALVGVAVGLSWGAVGVAWGFSIGRWVAFPIGVFLAFAGSPMRVAHLLAVLGRLATCLGCASGVTVAMRRTLPTVFTEPTIGSAVAQATVALITYALVAVALGVHRDLARIKPRAAEPGDARSGA